jgi:hypothetical protein
MNDIKLRCYISRLDAKTNKRVGKMCFSEPHESERGLGFMAYDKMITRAVTDKKFTHSWMRHVGVPDKNGNDLYEDDLGIYEYWIAISADPDCKGITHLGRGKIVFIDGAFMVENVETKHRVPFHYPDLTFEKTGNIHEGEK